MKNEFNCRSLASALARDVLTSVKRVHVAMRDTSAAMFYDHEFRNGNKIDKAMDTTFAAAVQVHSVILGAAAGGAAAATTGNSFIFVTGLLGGGVLLNPPIAKMAMKYFEFSGRGLDKLFNAMGGKQRPVREFPQFEAYPEFSKALHEPKPQ